MTTQYTTGLLRFGYSQFGDSGWATVLNDNHIGLLEEAIVGWISIATGDANVTLTSTDGTSDQARHRMLKFTGAMTNGRNVVVPSKEGWWMVWNATTGGFALTVKTAAGTGVAVHAGAKLMVVCDGSETYLVEAPLNALTAETSPATDDELAIFDTSAKLNKKMTFANFLKVINVLTEDTAPDETLDFLATYDASATSGKKVSIVNMLKRVHNLTQDTTPDVDADEVLTWDNSASTVKRALLRDLMNLTLLETLTTTSGSTATTGTLSQCKFIIFIVDGVSGTGTATLRIAISDDDGANYSGTMDLDQSPGSTYSRNAIGIITNTHLAATNKCVACVLGSGSGGDAAITVNIVSSENGVTNKIRFSISAGSFDAGSIYIYGAR